MKKRIAAALLAGLALGLTTAVARAGDPHVRWYTLQTPHFRVNFHGGLESLAQRTASIAEHAYNTLTPALDHRPSEVIEILLTDDADFANGSAGAVPYNAIRLYATAPDDMSALGEYDDWMNELLTHELTHILHVDNVSGLPALLNKILGKTAIPNQTQPRWILEGLAVAMETDHTSGGRLRSTQFDMFLRTDVLEHNFARLDQFSNASRRWPGGNLWYLYGSAFVQFINDTYGDGVYAAVADDYGAQVVPWGINRAIRRVTGRTYEELYEGWQKTLQQRYQAQSARIRARGLREGSRLTHRGQSASGARMTGHCSTLGKPSLIYARADADTPGGFYEIALDGSEPTGKLRARANGQSLGFAPDCSFLFEEITSSARRYSFLDLFRQLPGSSSPTGREDTRKRLTHGLRARNVDVSRDGRRVVYVTNDRGTSTLRIANLTPEFELENARALVPSAHYEQAYTPRFSRDGRQVAYSAWTTGGFRDIRIVDVETGQFSEPFHDRAIDQQPTFSEDGKLVYFSSDRSGVANIYAYELATRKLWQVTNVINGAYQPELSADEKTLVYLGYTHAGWDLFKLELDRKRWLEPEPYRDSRGAKSDGVRSRRYPVRPYSALPTLRPHQYFVEYGPGSFGNTLTITTSGSDIAGLHAISASVGIGLETKRSDPQLSLDYVYGRLPFSLQISGFRSAAPRTDYEYSERRPTIVEHLTGVATGVSIGAPRDYESERASLSYTIAEFAQRLPLGLPDPFAPLPSEPHRGFLGLLHLGYGYSSAEATPYAISPERGFELSIGTDFADPILGSDATLISFSATATGYVPMPWANHHVLALALSGGTGSGSYPRRGLFSVGGFADIPVLDSFTSNLRQSGVRLRGYEPGQFSGNDYNLANLEYRFPILYADRGISTLPVFLQTLAGNVFMDWGGAYDRLDLKDPLASYHLGVGAELWVDLVFGYFVGGTLRIGAAKGIDDLAPAGLQTYTVVSSAF